MILPQLWFLKNLVKCTECARNNQCAILLKDEAKRKTDSAVLKSWIIFGRIHCLNIKCNIYFGLFWNEMLSSLLIKTDANRNYDHGAPVLTSKLARDWIATNCRWIASKHVWPQPSGLGSYVWKPHFNPSWSTLISSRRFCSWYGNSCHRTRSTESRWACRKYFGLVWILVVNTSKICWNGLFFRFLYKEQKSMFFDNKNYKLLLIMSCTNENNIRYKHSENSLHGC